MHANSCLVGSDVELFGMVQEDTNSLDKWHEWFTNLGTIPDKGTRMDLGEGYWAHRDGISAEYGFAPTTNVAEFIERVHKGKALVEGVLGRQLYPVTHVNVGILLQEPWADKALDIGCLPDFELLRPVGYRRRSVPPTIRRGPSRECGGHIHISLPPPFVHVDHGVPSVTDLQVQFVRELDDALYPLAVGDNHPDYRTWYRRRKVFRPTTYGVEYRSLGAAELLSQNAEGFMPVVFDLVKSVWEV